MLPRALLAAAGLLIAGGLHAAPSVGQPAPDFSLKSATGSTVKLGDHRGKFVVLEWTNPGCPYVRKHYDSGNMPGTQADAVGKGVVWLSIDSTSRSSGEYLAPQQVAAWQQARKGRPTALLVPFPAPEGAEPR